MIEDDTKNDFDNDKSLQIIISILSFIILSVASVLLVVTSAIFTFLLFSGAIVYVIFFLVFFFMSYMFLNKFIHNKALTILAIFLVYVVLLFGYSTYIFYNPPVQKSLLENAKVCRVAEYIGITYGYDLTPFEYRSLAYHFRKGLQEKSPEQQKILWKRYVQKYKEKSK